MKNKLAEVKPAKFGERLTGGADANPEPSQKFLEGVETRRRVCKQCGNHIPEYKNKKAKYCSKQCCSIYIVLINII